MQTGLAIDLSRNPPDSASGPLAPEFQAARVQLEALRATVNLQSERIKALTRQLEWFKQQVFGARSEKRHVGADESQLRLGEDFVQAHSTFRTGLR
jgi:hypothetical protein